MRGLASTRYVLGICAAAALPGCGGSQSPIGAPVNLPIRAQLPGQTHPPGRYNVLYSFKGYPDDGAHPHSALLNLDGTFYGTTKGGGRYPCGDFPRKGCGTVFSVTPSGVEALLYSFKGNRHLASVYANGLINVNGTLYGTTFDGGRYALGTVFAISPSGKFTVLHNFTGRPDGRGPHGELLDVNGTLYGTSFQGGTKDNGTVFAITTSGNETIIHSFEGDTNHHTDAANPSGSLINVGGVLYGTTSEGGPYRNGTVFTITTSGKETVLYSFAGGGPRGSLININGVLYCTTFSAGTNGLGTVFAITRPGKEKWLYSFTGKPLDGAHPNAALVNRNGTLYGTTIQGGATDNGTLFAITRSGQESVLHDFNGARRSGAFPEAPLINNNGVLYGTTGGGGAETRGTVFSFTP
jgi:uncharacterized repeat protein (TIGR03803 family)